MLHILLHCISTKEPQNLLDTLECDVPRNSAGKLGKIMKCSLNDPKQELLSFLDMEHWLDDNHAGFYIVYFLHIEK